MQHSPSTALSLLTIRDAAKLLEIDERLLSAAVKSGQVLFVEISKRKMIPLAALERLTLGGAE